MAESHHSIKSVTVRTGLSPHVIRIWEKRYGAVRPERTDTNRRVYSEQEVERLKLLKRATERGHSIGNIARLELEELKKLSGDDMADVNAATHSAKGGPFIERCIAATQKLDAQGLEEALSSATVAFGQHGAIEQVMAPVAQAIGELWREGKITAAHEHFASAAIRVFLGEASRPFALPANAPHLVVATPAGQLHELGAVMVAASASDVGWRVTYLGTSLPAAEIAGCAAQHHAQAVALSVVYPTDDERLPAELENLRKYLPSEISILVGGRAAESYSEAIAAIGGIHCPDLRTFCAELDALRTRKEARKA